ncbi:MAG: FG-GAP repeat protein [Flavobacteriales bacterium]|nr:FG-GAP repeat protein [Flavobacteriales bacterium]
MGRSPFLPHIQVLIGLAVLGVACATTGRKERHDHDGRVTVPRTGPNTGLAVPSIGQAIDLHKVDATPMNDGAWTWSNPQGLKASVQADGVVLSASTEDTTTWTAALLLHRIGRAEDWSVPIEGPEMERTPKRTLARHGRFDLEQVNSDDGVRQNFIVHHRSKGDGPLRVELAVEGDLRCAHAGGDLFEFSDTSGTVRMRYHDLHVWDAQGDTLNAWATWEDEHIVLLVNDAGAAYPITVDPVATTPVWSVESNATNAAMGNVVSSAGDVNGDGYSDVLVGSSVWSNGQTGEGRAQVFLGGATGPAATAAWSYETDQLGANMGLGTSMSTAGDVNGDGYSDVIVAAPNYDNGQTDEGRVHVFHGSSSGLSPAPDWTIEIDQASARYGRSVACAGDVNGDGYSDVIIGAYLFDNGQADEGRVFVYHGGPTGLGGTAAWTAESDQASAWFGYAVAGAGDVNGDGFSDVIIGSPFFDNGQTNEGRIFVYHGNVTGLAAAPAWTVESDQAGAQAGYSVSTAGDTNGDGYADVIVGMPFYDGGSANSGRVATHLGTATGLNTTATWVSLAGALDDSNGQSVACAGDVNADGFSDVIIGSPIAGTGDEGLARIFLGSATGMLTFDWTQTSTTAGDNFGNSVASAGDVNGDGISDVIVGIPNYDNGQTNEGRARVYLGRVLGLGATGWGATGAAGSLFGRRIASAGDVNGDGYGDVIIGAEEFTSGQTLEGAAYVHHGSATGPSPGAVWTVQSNQAGWEFGSSVACAGDVNGDGFSDVIVGAPRAFGGIGRSLVYHGGATGLSTTAAFTHVGLSANEWGTSVASAGDVNGDGYSDVVIGSLAGFTLLYGSTTGVTNTGAVVLPGAVGSLLGASVATAGDVNGDGYSDVIVGAGGISGGAGRVQVHHGGPTGLNPAPAWTVNGTQAGASLGSSPISGPTCISAGDVNADGFSDVLVSEHYYDNGQVDEGRVNLFLGSATGLATTAAWTMEGNVAQIWFGVALGSAGDVNADGYSDVVIGACEGGTPSGTGRAYVYHGGPTGLSPAPNYFSTGPTANAEFGHSVSGAGDVDGDGDSDVLIGIHGINQVQQVCGNEFRKPRSNMRLYNTDLSTPISAANIPDPQFGMGLFVRPFLGRQRVRCVWETRIQGQPFSSAGGAITTSTAFTAQQATFTPGAVAGVELKNLVDKPGGGSGLTATKVRARVRYDPTTALTGQVFGPWRTMPGYQDGLGTHNNVPLPVELLRFDATCKGGVVELTWVTASETNSGHFTVERSPDGEVWSEVALVQAAGHSQHPMEYGQHDGTPPNTPVLYYRLRLTDLDGTDAVLATTTIAPCAAANVRIHPNPSSGLVAIDLSAFAGAARSVQLLDLNGQSVLTVPVNGPSTMLDLGPLPAATYLLRMLNEAGYVLATERLVKH